MHPRRTAATTTALARSQHRRARCATPGVTVRLDPLESIDLYHRTKTPTDVKGGDATKGTLDTM